MKKSILSLIFIALASSLFAFQAQVVSTSGKAEVQNGSSWVALKEGDMLNSGSVIQTGFKSELVLKIKESTVTVAPLSRLTLQTLIEREGLSGAQGKDETAIFLDTGALKSNVQKSSDRRVGFTVRSPVATASVRGTEFSFSTRYKGCSLTTTEGRVAFWKNTAQSEARLNNMSDEPVGDANMGFEAQDISEYAPQSAIVVSKGEVAAVDRASKMKPPAEHARETATSLGTGTLSAAGVENGGVQPKSNSTAQSKTASITVILDFGDSY